MKKLKILLIALIALIAMSSQSQTFYKRWTIGAGLYFADFVAPQLVFPDQFKNAYWNHNGIPVRISLGRYITDRLTVEANYAMVELDNPKLADNLFWQGNLGLQFKILKDSWFDPYFYGNGGIAFIDGNGSFTYNGGFGLNVWFKKTFGLYAQAGYGGIPAADKSTYKVTADGANINYKITDDINYSFGLRFNLGKPKDTDGDKVPDKIDKCPETPGVKALDGCPDSDGDGIPDKSDKCPDVAGTEEFAGCPDSDGDKVIDKNDLCPDVPGLSQFDGCPDNDGDGIPDKDDDCPDVAGLKKFVGCPDSDNDGIKDSEDDCPNVPGPVTNKGCPEPEKPPVVKKVKINAPDIIVYFDFNMWSIGQEDKKPLKEALETLEKNPALFVEIGGHTDDIGKEDLNMKLSEHRAEIVAKYLENNGISSKRISLKYYGESFPASTNNTPEGQALNRRAVIKFLQND